MGIQYLTKFNLFRKIYVTGYLYIYHIIWAVIFFKFSEYAGIIFCFAYYTCINLTCYCFKFTSNS
jgi:hypothetical protein